MDVSTAVRPFHFVPHSSSDSWHGRFLIDMAQIRFGQPGFWFHLAIGASVQVDGFDVNSINIGFLINCEV